MKALAKLKDDARKHEQREEWEKAIEAYVQVLKTTDGGAEHEAELPLYNRIGDLFVRLARPLDAVTYYERAADHYAELGLFNNAIALCNKALRYLPSRLELLRKLGQFSAAQGFITDARRWYLEYAERQLKQGAVDDAFQALEDFAQVHEDAEIRELLGRQLYAHNRPAEAITALTRARELRLQAGETEVASFLTQEILSIDPAARPAASASAPPRAAPPPPPPAPAPPPAAPAPPPPPPPATVPPAAQKTVERQEPSAPPAHRAPAVEARSSAAADLPGLPEPPAAPAKTGSFEDAIIPDDDPITSDEPEFEEIESEPEDALATFDSARDDSTAGLEGGFIDLDSIPDINAPFDLSATGLNLLGGDMPTYELKEVKEVEAPPPPDLSFLDGLQVLDPIESQFGEPLSPTPPAAQFEAPTQSIPPESPFEGFTGFTEFSVEQVGSDVDEVDSEDVPSEPLPYLDPEAGFEADVDFNAPPAPATPAPQTDSVRIDFEYEELIKHEPIARPPFAKEEAWTADEAEPELESAFDELSGEGAYPGAQIEAEPETSADVAESESPRFRYESMTYPDAAEEIASEGASEPEWAADEDEVVELPLIEPAAAEIAEELATESAESVDDGVEEAIIADEPEAEFVAESEIDDVVAEAFTDRAEVEAEAADREQNTHREAIPGWVPPAPPPGAEPVLPTPQPALVNGALELSRIRALIAAGDRFAAVSALEALHPKLAAGGQMHEAWEAVDKLLELYPDSLRVLQHRVEYAAASGDLELGLRSYLDLGRFLSRTGAGAKARVIFQRVLDLDPHNREANAFMKASAPPKVTSGYVDLLALVADEEGGGDNTRFKVAEKPPTGDEDRDFADMLAQFKEKVAENVSLSESGAHYDLGLAFKEMGLIDEAIAEFQVALKGGEERLKVYEELGQCFLLKEQYTVAVTVLNRALTLPVKDDSDLLGVYYSLGRSYEGLGRPGDARNAYERVVGIDISFRDASERLGRL
jgi:tetratricopeptide (TPR) repeat protein